MPVILTEDNDIELVEVKDIAVNFNRIKWGGQKRSKSEKFFSKKNLIKNLNKHNDIYGLLLKSKK